MIGLLPADHDYPVVAMLLVSPVTSEVSADRLYGGCEVVGVPRRWLETVIEILGDRISQTQKRSGRRLSTFAKIYYDTIGPGRELSLQLKTDG